MIEAVNLANSAAQVPLVKRAIEQLEAQIVHVDDGFAAAQPGPGDRIPEADIDEA